MMQARFTSLPAAPQPRDRSARLAEWVVRRLLSPLAATAYCCSLMALVLVSFSPSPAERAPMLIGAAIGAAFVIVLASLLVVMSVLRLSLFSETSFDD